MGKYLQGAAPNAANAFLSSALIAAEVNGDTAEVPEVVQRVVLAYPVELEGEGEVGQTGVQDLIPQDIVWSVNALIDGSPIGGFNPMPAEVRFRVSQNSQNLYPVSYDMPLPMVLVAGMSTSKGGEQVVDGLGGDLPLAYFGYTNSQNRRDWTYVECLLRNDTDADLVVQLHNWTFGFSFPVVTGEITVPVGQSAFVKWPVARGDNQVVATSYGTTGTLRYSSYLS